MPRDWIRLRIKGGMYWTAWNLLRWYDPKCWTRWRNQVLEIWIFSICTVLELRQERRGLHYERLRKQLLLLSRSTTTTKSGYATILNLHFERIASWRMLLHPLDCRIELSRHLHEVYLLLSCLTLPREGQLEQVRVPCILVSQEAS